MKQLVTLENRTIIVTGAAQGIGRACCELLPLMHRRGYLPLLIEATMMRCEGLGNQNVQVRSSPRSRLSCW